MALTKITLVNLLFEKMGLTKHDAKKIVNAFFEEIKLSLVSGKPIKLSGFGSFYLRDKSERVGRNPKTGEPFVISARRVVIFRASEKIKKMAKQVPSH